MQAYVPETVTVYAVLTAITLALIVALIFSFIWAFIELLRSKNFFKSFSTIFTPVAGFSIPISIVAYFSGLLTASSRTSAIANVIPAVLALIGGLNIYVFGSDNKHKVHVAFCVLLFSIMLFYGTEYGAYRREADRELRFEDLARQELQIRILRKNLGLPDEVPSWMTSSEPK